MLGVVRVRRQPVGARAVTGGPQTPVLSQERDEEQRGEDGADPSAADPGPPGPGGGDQARAYAMSDGGVEVGV